MAKSDSGRKFVAINKKARFEYEIVDTLEAGIVLLGSEVKSAREGRVSITEGFVAEAGGELFLYQTNIQEYKGANRFNHDPTRPRKLLLKKREIRRFLQRIKLKGMTIVPLNMRFNERGILKLEIGLAEGKSLVDKRETIKERDWSRQKHRILKGDGD